MNFFSHFMVDHQIHKPSYNVALIAPDLLRNFTPKHCKFPFSTYREMCAPEGSNPNPNLFDFFTGCLQHIQRDKQFHQSEFFQNTYQLLRDPWRETCLNYDIPKYWFSIHVLVEMMLDKYFIDNNLEKLHLFYNQLSSERNTYEKALNFMSHPTPDLFLERYSNFCEKQYLFHYQEFGRIAFALHKVYQQVGLPTQWYDENETHIVEKIKHCHSMAEHLFSNVQNVT